MGHRAVAARRAASFLFACLLAVSVVAPATATAGATPSARASGAAEAKLDKGLARELATKGTSRYVVEFAGEPDLRPAYKIKDHAKRGAFVYVSLTANARKVQAGALDVVHRTKGAKAESRWLTNWLVVTGDAKLAAELAKRPEVLRVRPIRIYPLVKPIPAAAAIAAAAGDPEWGAAKIRADEVWAEGITGQGVVVASIDTGVDFTHPALVNNYRGNNHDGTFTHDYNWWDPSGVCPGLEPCDNVFHGTHTMGTIAGGDGPGPFTPDIGVAPGATWITAKGCEDLGCSDTALVSSGEFMLAPTKLDGTEPRPDLRPDIISNSWGDGPGNTFYDDVVTAWRAAGIIPVFAAGNAGPDCGSGGSPGDYTAVIAAGATDIDDTIADFSSRGPSVFGKVNPDVSAPGVDVTSSVPGGGFDSFSGTSMATPHVAGTLALMISSKLSLAGQFDAAADALKATAIDRIDAQCGGDADGDPNNVYGDGRIDAKAAVDLVKTGGTLSGTITDDTTTAPVAGARITADDGSRTFSAVTGVAGDYELFLAAGSYAVRVDAFGFETGFAAGVTIVTDEVTDQDFALTPLPRFDVTGHVAAAEDGSALEGVRVAAIGTPVPAAITNASGDYTLTLPIGTYTLRAAGGGCTESGTGEVTLVDANVSRDFTLFRKLDDFGHGCRSIGFDWVDAPTQSALFGDEFAGRLRLPFAFDFYGQSYDAVFISDNGYLNFLGPDQFNGFPSAIPSASPPNAAIYAFWQDLRLDTQSSIDYTTVGVSPDRAFVIEYSQVRAGSARVDFEIKLGEDGTIDLLYGANPPNPGDGRRALVGIENATGADALEFSFLDDLIGPNDAYRFEHVPTGIVRGTVTDANDGLPIAGATVGATPGGRSATTAADGTYSLKLRPGSYAIGATARSYVDGSQPAAVTDGGDLVADFSLAASKAAADPLVVRASVDFGQTTSAQVTLSNAGTAPLDWAARERDQGATLPDLPPVPTVNRGPHYGSAKLPASVPRAIVRATDFSSLPVIIDDPDDDSTGLTEITSVRALSDGSQTSIAIDYKPGTPVDQVGGYVYFDTDQDPSTGLPPEAFFGKPTQDIGFDYFATLSDLSGADPIVPVFNVDGDLIAVVPATVTSTSVAFSIPLDALGGDDGLIDVAMDNGTGGPEDWAPDIGHGTIQSFSDLPWLSETPDVGQVPVGGSQAVTLNLGAPGIEPGTYHALVVFVTNAPKQTQVPVDVTLEVRLPADFGRVTGTVSDAHTGEPIAGAPVVLHAQLAGNPFDRAATTAADGSWSILGPAGSWPTDFSADGYVPVNRSVAIVAGGTRSGEDVALHRLQPHATADGGPFAFVLTPGRQAHGTISLSNAGGHSALDFRVGERPIATETNAGRVSALAAGVDSHRRPAGHIATKVAPSVVGQPTLVLMDTLPWDSDGLLQVLDANGIAHDQAGSAEIGTIDLNPYKVVFIANDQSQAFYDTYLANFGRIDAYVQGGGILWFEAASFGFQDGNLDGVHVPGGLTIHGPQFEESNKVAAPDHPMMAGLPNPFKGSSASHTTFSDLPAGGSVIATAASSDLPTLVEYDHGAGHVIALAQTLEFAWSNDEDGKLILENGVPYAYALQTLADVPWLTVTPTDGSVAPDGSTTLDVSVDTTGLTPGLYRANVIVLTNDPDHGAFAMPVTLVVPAFQQGVNAGGGSYANAGGDVFAADRAYAAGSFGYLGTSSSRSTTAPIAGTAEDGLYQDLRMGMTGYRFDLANGHYRVDLAFAEILLRKAGDRVFGISIEGTSVVANLDVFAAAGGRNVALDRSFEVDVIDGHLDIAFTAQRGDKPIVNAILVTELPPGAPGV